jgi:uncharacterized membrane protein
MEEVLHTAANVVATGLELAMLAVIAIGAVEAVFDIVRQLVRRAAVRASIHETWLRFAAWIVLALEFALAADVIRTIVTPGWDEIGMLAAIGTIRTVLGYFIGRDIEEFRHKPRASPEEA